MKKLFFAFFMMTSVASATFAAPFYSNLDCSGEGCNGYSANAAVTIEEMVIGADENTVQKDNGFYVGGTNLSSEYTFYSYGDMTIDGTLTIAADKGLIIRRVDATGSSDNVTIGAVIADGALTLGTGGMTGVAIANLTFNGAVKTNAGLNINADSILNGGASSLTLQKNGNIVSQGVFHTGNIINNGGTGNDSLVVTTGTMDVTGLQNVFLDGTTNTVAKTYVTVTGTDSGTTENPIYALNINGNMENQVVGDAGVMEITAINGTVNVVGTAVNAGNMVITAKNLDIAGGASNSSIITNHSFVNSGNLTIDVTGNTTLGYGFDLSGMGANDKFSLTTGVLTFGDTHAWETFLNNAVNDWSLNIKNGNLLQDTVRLVNSGQNMSVAAKSIALASIENTGVSADNRSSLKIAATGDGNTDGITVGTEIVADNGNGLNDHPVKTVISSVAGTTTDIDAAGNITVYGLTNNAGTMTLSSKKQIEMSDIYNTGALNVLASTGENGKIIVGMTGPGVPVNGHITNAGDLRINARQIEINGVLKNTAGTTKIIGSDTMENTADELLTVVGMNAVGGLIDVSAIRGGVNVAKSIDVTGGTLNFASNVGKLEVGSATTRGTVDIAGDLIARAADTVAAGGGNMFIDATGGAFSLDALGADSYIKIGGNVSLANGASESHIRLSADNITVGENVFATNNGTIALSGKMLTAGAVSADAGSTIEINTTAATVESLTGDGKFIATGTSIDAKDTINIAGGISFGADAATGMVVSGTNSITLTAGNDIIFGGNSNLVAGNTLSLVSNTGNVTLGNMTSAGTLDIDAISGAANFAMLTNNTGGVLTVDAASVAIEGIINAGTGTINSSSDLTSSTGVITNNGGVLTLVAADDITAGGLITATAGDLKITAKNLVANGGLKVLSGGVVTLDAQTVQASADGISVAGNIIHGAPLAGQDATNGALLMTNLGTSISGNNLSAAGIYVNEGTVTYDMTGRIDVTGGMAIASGTDVKLSANRVNVTDIIENNGGALMLGSRDVVATARGLTILNGGTVTLAGRGFDIGTADLNVSALYQNHDSALANGINVKTDGNAEFVLGAGSMTFGLIDQMSGKMALNTQNLTVNGNINAKNLAIFADNVSALDVKVQNNGNVSGGVQFRNLGAMEIAGDYIFDDNSALFARISTASAKNYWSSVSLNEDNTLGQIVNAANGAALINVGKQFKSELTLTPAANNQVGIGLYELVDQGTAIWLLHADNGIVETGNKIRNLSIVVCNQSGTRCYDYFDASKYKDSDLPAYLTVRDADSDGVADDIYVVFDPRFGGPVEVFKIQPIVERDATHTSGEYMSAGALDNMVADGLKGAGFVGRQAIEAIPVAFRGTNLETVANQLYKRMEQYNADRNGAGFARFSRLFQPREIEQVAGAVVMNDHIASRDFEDHMFDEFIWNRNRNLKKAWGDLTFGTFSQNTSDDKTVSGNRFSVFGGFDWQSSQTLILGLAGRVSHMSSDTSDAMNLGYGQYDFIDGQVEADVADTNVAFGGYLMKILGDKTRLYGNAFLDMHFFDISRDQTYMSAIDGSGTAFGLSTEWGLLHDWLNQYIVGNAYVRAGYNFGFSVTERASGGDYMNFESDGYLMFTPGYSLTAQKRIYPSSWFQIRPYASIGIEYDVLGAPRDAQYKFAVANGWTDYKIDIDPLWANIGGGLEMLSVRGFQLGIDYRYQYNADISLHNIKLSGLFRF